MRRRVGSVCVERERERERDDVREEVKTVNYKHYAHVCPSSCLSMCTFVCVCVYVREI
jgi:hypothetical protein